MKEQIELIKNKDWDVLCVLDACRFDYFRKLYPGYFKGNLRKSWSGGSNTHEWCLNYIDNHQEFWKDVTVFSANPHINSSVPLPNAKFNPVGKFKKVYDIWTKEYTNNIGTTPPEKLSKAYLKNRNKVSGKAVLWFIQPHSPYLLFPDLRFSGIDPKGLGNKSEWKKAIKRQALGLEGILSKFPMWAVKPFWTLWNGLFGMAGIRRVLVEKGQEALVRAYKYNLERALASIENIFPDDGKIVITADHGDVVTWEERKRAGFLDHPAEKDWWSLREVPWFEVKNGRGGE